MSDIRAQRERYALYQCVAAAEDDATVFFPLRPEERPATAAQRIRARLSHDLVFRYRVRAARNGAWVTKVGRWSTRAEDEARRRDFRIPA